MPAFLGPTAIQRSVAFTVPFFAMAWLVTVPAVLTPTDFFAVVGLLVAFGWVARTTVLNGQAVGSLAQLLHETERSGSLEHPRGTR
jgi:hypothetical protein